MVNRSVFMDDPSVVSMLQDCSGQPDAVGRRTASVHVRQLEQRRRKRRRFVARHRR